MKRSPLLTYLIVICSLLILSSSAQAVSLWVPEIIRIELGVNATPEEFDLPILIRGLDENQNLAEFDFTVIFDPSILTFKSYKLYDYLGSGDDVLDWSLGDIGDGKVNISEISWLQDFAEQPSTFRLAVLRFETSGSSISPTMPTVISPIIFEGVTLGDEFGDRLEGIIIQDGEVAVSTPEPATMLLLGIGLIGVVGLRRKFGK